MERPADDGHGLRSRAMAVSGRGFSLRSPPSMDEGGSAASCEVCGRRRSGEMAKQALLINRAPVLTLWGAVVAARMGYDWKAALTLGRAVAGLNAQTKGRRLGIFGPPKAGEGKAPRKVGLGEEFWVEVCGRPVPAKRTGEGIRAVVGPDPIDPAQVEAYLRSKFGDDLQAARAAMEELAASYRPADLAAEAFGLYERFRPAIAAGVTGWGQKGKLDLDLIRSFAGPRPGRTGRTST